MIVLSIVVERFRSVQNSPDELTIIILYYIIKTYLTKLTFYSNNIEAFCCKAPKLQGYVRRVYA